MTPEIHDLGSCVETRLSEVARSHGRTMEAEAAAIRVVDVFVSLPEIFVALVVLAFIGGNLPTLVGTIGILENLGKPATNRWGFGPLLTWTVPTNGSRARIRQAEASTQAALAHFDGVVLNAIRETQTSLAQYSALLDRRDALADLMRRQRRGWDWAAAHLPLVAHRYAAPLMRGQMP